MSMDIPKLKHRNRIQAKSPKLGRTWCYSCDAGIVGDGVKCPCCGKKRGKTRLKKD